jgi:ATP-independent RNA helicase DbpA
LDLGGIALVILDEADRMLDMGFKEKIEKILSLTPPERQTALFSATFPVTITALSRRFQRDPERITVETPADQAAAIDQFAFRVSETEKTASLAAFLRSRPLESVLVFCNQKFRVDELADFLREAGHSVGRLHGDLEQAERERVMAKFRNLSTRILVATDVAARGIDVIGLDAVINFDLPSDPQVYVHRIGRTGRAGKTGLALSLLTPIESEKANRIVALTGTPLRIETPASGKSVPAGGVSATMDTLSISAGRKEKLRPGDILGALTGDAGVPGDQVGKIEILDHVSFVAVDRQSSALAYDRLRNGKIKGRRFLVQWVK